MEDIRIKLTEEQKLDVIKLIESEMEVIKKEYDDAEFNDKIRKAQEEYDGVHEEVDFPIQDASNRKILLTTLACDILASKGKRQTFLPSPAIIYDDAPEGINPDYLREREDNLDSLLRKKTNYPDLSLMIYREAAMKGACIVKVPYCKEESVSTSQEKYSKDDIGKYEEGYKDKFSDTTSQEYQNWLKLQNGENIELNSESKKTTYSGAKPYIVPLDKFFARLKLKDMKRQRVISEQIDFVWSDISLRLENGYYDEEGVNKLKELEGEEYYKKDYKVYESIVLWDKEGNGKFRRYIITFDDRNKIILRSIIYPYEHGEICYEVYNVIPKPDSWWGYSFAERLEDTTTVVNAFVNATINEFTLKHKRFILCDDPTFEGKRVPMDNYDIVKFTKGSQFLPVPFETTAGDRVGFIQWAINMGELITGVQASLMSGQESAFDPRAPLGKTAIKLQESNSRIEDMVMCLQKSDERVARQIDGLYEQYEMEEGEKISDRVRYVAQGSRISFDKEQDLRVVMATINFLSQMYPETWGNIDVKARLLSDILNCTDGSIQKSKKVIMKPMELMQKAKEEQKQMIESGQGMPEGMPVAGENMSTTAGVPPSTAMMTSPNAQPDLPPMPRKPNIPQTEGK